MNGAGRKNMPVLYYIRHGETDFNAEQRLQGLSAEELRELLEKLKGNGTSAKPE